jgi:hypothetical protein
MQPRTPAQIIQAIDQLVRMKTAEEPPDLKGHRQIWHHSDAGGELVTIVDGTGRVVRQELTLFDDFVMWQPGARIRTGTMPARDDRNTAPIASKATYDTSPNRDRIDRVREAFDGYTGDDLYVQHIKRLVESTRHSGFPAASVVTRVVDDVRRPSKKGGSLPWALIALIGVAIVGLAMLALARRL